MSDETASNQQNGNAVLKVLVSAGEVSGDQRAADVLRQLLVKTKADIRGMGGECLEALGVQLVVDSRKMAGVMGFTEVLSSLGGLRQSFHILKELLRDWKPDVVFLVDFPEFNLLLAKAASTLGIKVYYHIPPKVWVWRGYRVSKFSRYVSRVSTLFPFEQDFFRSRGYKNAFYSGHPFLTTFRDFKVDRAAIRSAFIDDPEQKLVLVLPGSRKGELVKHVPVFIEAIQEYRNNAKNPQQFVWVLPDQRLAESCCEIAVSHSYQPLVHVGDAREIMSVADAGMLKSGTCNLEAAFCGLPHLVVYRASILSAILFKCFVGLPEVSIVNLLRSGTVKEFLQDKCEARNVAGELKKLLEDERYRNAMKSHFGEIIGGLETGVEDDPSKIVADDILEMTGRK